MTDPHSGLPLPHQTIPESPLRLAAVQLCSTKDREGNLARAAALIDQAAGEGAELVALPENFGYLDREGEKLAFVEELSDGPSVAMCRNKAARHGIHLAGGTVPLPAADGRVTNTMLVWGPDGSLVSRYDKIHLFDISLDDAHVFKESRYVSPGSDIVTIDINGWRFGLSICYDLRFPELYRALADRGAHAYLAPAAFTAKTGLSHWELLLRARAVENQSYVIAPAQWGRHNERRESYGDTAVVDPWGEVVARRRGEDGLVFATLDPERLRDVRRRLPALLHRTIRTGSAVRSNWRI